MGRLSILRDVTIVCAALVGVLADTAHAEGRAFVCSKSSELSSTEARELLGKVQSTYASIETLHGGFKQDSYVAALDEQETSSGEMWFGKPGKMRWVYAKPRPQTVVINGGTLWLYQPENRQVVIDDIGNVLLSSLPVSFMMGLGNLSRDFELKGACKGSEGVVLQLVPHKKGEKEGQGDSLDGFDLLVDAAQGLPKGAKISSLGGNTTEIVFSDLSTKEGGQPEGRFVLEYPKGVDVMDRRLSH
jgi:outer membrane lipoprotein carrier protein